MTSRPAENEEALSSAARQLGERHPSKLASPTPITGMARIKSANDR